MLFELLYAMEKLQLGKMDYPRFLSPSSARTMPKDAAAAAAPTSRVDTAPKAYVLKSGGAPLAFIFPNPKQKRTKPVMPMEMNRAL